MESGVTIKIKLKLPNVETAASFEKNMEQFRLACNFISEYIFNYSLGELNKNKIQKAIYRDVRNNFGLKSQMAISAIRCTVDRYKTVRTQLKKHPMRYKSDDTDSQTGKRVWKCISRDLYWLWYPINFKRPQVDLQRGKDWSYLKSGQLSINTLDKRVKVDFDCHGFDQYLDGTWKLGVGKLLKSQGKWYLHISCTKEIDEFNDQNIEHVVGIDRGLHQIIAAYDEQGRSLFANGKQIAKKRNHYYQLRRHLQMKNTRNSKRRIRKIGNRENRWMDDVNHCLSKTLINHYGKNTLFVLEDLSGVSFDEDNQNSKDFNRDLHSWTFYDLETKLTYKAQLNHSKVIEIDAHYTSQRCPKCGRIRKESRDRNLHMYICDKCGYKSNDDRIAAMNIYNLGTFYVSGVEHPTYQNKLEKIKNN